MHNDTQTWIGKVLTNELQKDAIHIAVYPATSEQKVFPGQWVSLVKDGVVTPSDDKPIGIVDPFLAGSVFPGARFFVFITPNTITGMRHEWTHPAFAKKPEPQVTAPTKAESEMWLNGYVRLHCPYWEYEQDGGYSEFLRKVTEDRYIFYYGSDCHSLSDVDNAEELFRHLSVVLGKQINADYFEAFTCSC